jgi:aminomethyltransferase
MRTALYDDHVALGGKMVPFAGWEMPLQYRGIIHEHLAVRTNAGIFDVSHMGRIQISGKDAEPFLDYLSTNKIKGKPPLSATYTVWPNVRGGSVDDLIVYKEDDTHFFVIVNAGNRSKDLDHVKSCSHDYDVEIRDRFAEEGILAVQGPQALALCAKMFPEVSGLQPMHFLKSVYRDEEIILSGTGYTGAGGLEIYASNKNIVELWRYFIHAGIEPIGLGARDTLRLEMGYALYGHELSDEISANESVSARTVKWKKGDFLGKRAMLTVENNPQKRREYGIVLTDKGIAREGYAVLKEDDPIGRVTSGTFSPVLNQPIAIILVTRALKEGDTVQVQIRDRRVQARISSLPFVKNVQKS